MIWFQITLVALVTEVTIPLHPLLLIAVILIAQQIPSQLGGAVGSHRSGKRGKGSAQRKGGVHRVQPRHLEPYAWLGAGAITLGIGTALASGSGVAHADDTTSAGSASASSTSGDSGAPARTTSGGSARMSSTDEDSTTASDPAPGTPSIGQPGDLNSSTPSSTAPTPASTSGAPPSEPTHTASVPEMNYSSSGGALTSRR